MYEKELAVLKQKNRLRERKLYDENIIDLASNDYLGLAHNGQILDKAYTHAKKYRSHAAKASMLVNGYHPSHQLLEEKLKKLNNFEDALILGSGFLANLALFELGRKGDLFIVDEEYHASGIIGSRLTGAEVKFFAHNDIEDLAAKAENYKNYKRVFVVVEGVYSMEGDKVLKEITDFAQEIGILIIDEAHSVGVLGDNLMGITDEYNLNPEKTVKMGTLGKALGSYGAYILANKEIIQFLLNRAKSVIYTTALSPMDTLTAYYSLEEIEKNINFYKREINKRKLILNSDSLIKILPAQDNKALLLKQKHLFNRNILIGAIRPPTVKTPIFRIIGRLDVEIDIIQNTIDFLKE
ncbi:aminotransferase [Nautilia sp. PV-1]|uniref:aminotransferase class I/II-fold pyridoxal phosphate-dependent enzyme n=1 Tax=Nautilia sp. PV-1 TaxID=2579250 RepID=UPI000FD89997|nr:pyridoxal phosphate-dependent aminotransferase family protein [Nautilia sp. PV-1]AZV45830.1 aminotransferase [Nautilia sp. PV-1]